MPRVQVPERLKIVGRPIEQVVGGENGKIAVGDREQEVSACPDSVSYRSSGNGCKFRMKTTLLPHSSMSTAVRVLLTGEISTHIM